MYKTPSLMCMLNGALPVDAGTLSPGSSQARGTVNAVPPNPSASLAGGWADLLGGWRARNQVYPLTRLLGLRDDNECLRQRAANELGMGRPLVRELQEVVDFFDAAILEARSPRGVATQRLSELTAQVRDQPGSRDEAAVFETIRALLGAEAKVQREGGPDPLGAMPIAVFADALNALADAEAGEFDAMVASAEAGDATATDEKLRAHTTRALGFARQQALMGTVSDDAPSTVMSTVLRALTVVAARHRQALRQLVEAATRPGSTVTDGQLRDALVQSLGDDRQLALLGADDKALGTMASVMEVFDLRLTRSKARLSRLLDQFATPGAVISREQVAEAVAELKGIGSGRQSFGSEPDDEQTVLIDRAAALFQDRPAPAPALRPALRVVVELGTVTIVRAMR